MMVVLRERMGSAIEKGFYFVGFPWPVTAQRSAVRQIGAGNSAMRPGHCRLRLCFYYITDQRYDQAFFQVLQKIF